MVLCVCGFKGRTFGTHSIYLLPIRAQLRKCPVMNGLAALRLPPGVVLALRCSAVGNAAWNNPSNRRSQSSRSGSLTLALLGKPLSLAASPSVTDSLPPPPGWRKCPPSVIGSAMSGGADAALRISSVSTKQSLI